MPARWTDGITIDEILAPGFSTPWDAPTVPPFPFSFRDAQVLTTVYRTDLDAVRSLLPPPLEPTTDLVVVNIYKMNDTDWIGPYAESNVMVGAVHPASGVSGGYSPYLFLTSEVGVVHGREVHGQPKKLGQPKLEFRGDLIVGTVARNGIDIITATLPYKQRRAELETLLSLFDFRTNLNLKAIDHIDGRPAIRQITARRLNEVKVRECWSGLSTMEIRPNAQAPVHRLPVREMLDAYYWVGDFTLVAGTVLHDYLAEAER
jgi:acetoacetate decarboxylase